LIFTAVSLPAAWYSTFKEIRHR